MHMAYNGLVGLPLVKSDGLSKIDWGNYVFINVSFYCPNKNSYGTTCIVRHEVLKKHIPANLCALFLAFHMIPGFIGIPVIII